MKPVNPYLLMALLALAVVALVVAATAAMQPPVDALGGVEVGGVAPAFTTPGGER